MVNPHLHAGDEEISQLIAEEWKGDGVTRIHAQVTSENLDNFEKIVPDVILKKVQQPLRKVTTKMQKCDLDIRRNPNF